MLVLKLKYITRVLSALDLLYNALDEQMDAAPFYDERYQIQSFRESTQEIISKYMIYLTAHQIDYPTGIGGKD